MKQVIFVLAGIVVVETAFLAFVLTAYSQRIDRLERAVQQVSAGGPPALANRHSGIATVRF